MAINMKMVIDFLKNKGIQVDGKITHFVAVHQVKDGKVQKCLRTTPCKKCGYKYAIVFRAVENSNLFLSHCPKCNARELKSKNATPAPNKDNRVGETPDDKCKGKTVKGARCKNRAMANGYCRQHQDQAPTAGPAYEGQGRATKHLQETRI